MKQRLDQSMVRNNLVPTRSQAESFIKLGQVTVNKKTVTKPGTMITDTDVIQLHATEQYVSRAGLKLASIAQILKLDFTNTVVLDVGSSTGGFTDYALQHGAEYVIAVDVGTNQLHPSLRGNPKIELHEQTDIRDIPELTKPVDIVLMDVSFISVRDILPYVYKLITKNSQLVIMVKPQFENDRMRRDILQDFENWAKNHFVLVDKADSEVAGAKGNRERFYLLKKA